MKLLHIGLLLLCLTGLSCLSIEALAYSKCQRLADGNRVVVGKVLSEKIVRSPSQRVGKKSGGGSYSQIKLEVAFDCCGGTVIKEIVAKEEWEAVRDGHVELLWDGNCPPYVVLKEHPYTGIQNVVFGAVLIVAGMFGFIAAPKKAG